MELQSTKSATKQEKAYRRNQRFLKQATILDLIEALSLVADQTAPLQTLVNDGFLRIDIDTETGLEFTLTVDNDFIKSTLGEDE